MKARGLGLISTPHRDVCRLALAVTLGLSPVERLAWATHFMIANLLVFALMWGWLCEYVATAMLYWRDRRSGRREWPMRCKTRQK